MRLPSLLIGLIILSACSDSPTFSTTTMAMPSGGPFQVITYDERPVERELIEHFDGENISITKSVYLSRRGQFIFKNEAPVTLWSGEHLYLNSDGQIVSDGSPNRIVGESEVFSQDGKPVPDGTALTILNPFIEGRAAYRKLTNQRRHAS